MKKKSYQTIQHKVRFLVVSPHPDDAALSTGGLLSFDETNWEKHILTLIGKSNYEFNSQATIPDIERISSIRSIEDSQFCKIIKATLHQGNALDAPLRNFRKKVFYFPTKDHILEFETLIDSTLKIIQPNIMFVPLGIGGHADHIACYQASINIAKKRNIDLLFYEDLPYAYFNYKKIKKNHEKWIFSLGKKILKKIENLKVYESQFDFSSMKNIIMDYAWNGSSWVETYYTSKKFLKSKGIVNCLKLTKSL